MTQPPGEGLSHLDSSGEAQMVDVSAKAATVRTAVARGAVRCDAVTAALIAAGDGPKGEVLGPARLAGIMAAKRTAELIPLCHPLTLTHVEVHVLVDPGLPGVWIEATVRCTGATGVEMEALTAVAVAALTVVDMAKGSDPWMSIEQVGLVSKEGGRHGTRVRPASS